MCYTSQLDRDVLYYQGIREGLHAGNCALVSTQLTTVFPRKRLFEDEIVNPRLG